jgi:hypothetical protein
MQSYNIPISEYKLHAGCRPEDIIKLPMRPFSNLAVNFLGDLSKALMADCEARKYPDVISFAFWSRPASLNKKHKELTIDQYSIGRGLALHIAPSNVPVNFAFSFAFGLLSGNANLVRVPEMKYLQTKIILQHIDLQLNKSKYSTLKSQNSLFYYERNDEINLFLSNQSDCRLIWGGDQTINYFKSIATQPRNIDICFANRYSISMFGAKEVLLLGSFDLKKLCKDFYNDNFLFNQFACSSSHLINWQGSNKDIVGAKKKFWSEMNLLAQAAEQMTETDYIDRFAKVGSLAFQYDDFTFTSKLSDAIYRSDLQHNTNFEDYRVGYGYFSEINNISNKELALKISNRYQTITYFGIDAVELAENFIDASVEGIDRIVPVGSGLNLDLIWDGYDIIRTLSRIIEVK